MAGRLYVIEDDLIFAQRVRATAQRLGLEATFLQASEATERAWEAGSVAVLQVTLNPDRQLALVERLLQAAPPPLVVAVSGHLETDLRSRAKALGAILAAHSSMERVLARACQAEPGLNDRAGDGHGRRS
ncbi:MAG: hypothetical protein PVSMB9_11030 [Candidatus Dormibacteria bacterium]